MAKRIKTYRVAYAVTRTELYDIDARNEKDAQERAFGDGVLGEEGETTNVEFCWIERRSVPAKPAKARRASDAPGYTPGRWCSDGVFITAPDPAGVHPDIYIAEIVQADDEGRLATPREQYANAQLIAAAPDLLAALEYFFNIMHDYQSSRGKGYVAYALESAREAIAKATGGRQ